MGSFMDLAETPTLSRGSPRAGPHSPRGAGPHCTVTACLVLTRQVNSIPPLLSPFFPPFPPSLPLPLPPLSALFLLFLLRFYFSIDDLLSTYSVFLLLTSWSLLRRRRRVSQTSNGRRLFLYTVYEYIVKCMAKCIYIYIFLRWRVEKFSRDDSLGKDEYWEGGRWEECWLEDS